MPDKTTTASSPPASKTDGNSTADEIPLPLFVSAEAAVKSARKDYVSLFDPKADLDNLKTCRSDPALMKQAVKKLKEVGFKVTSIGRFSVRIQGPPKLYKEQFGVKLTMVAFPAESPGDTPTNFAVFASASDDPAGSPTPLIPIPKTSTLADSIASVFLDPPAAPTRIVRKEIGSGSGSRSTDPMTEPEAKDRNKKLNIAYLDELSGLLGGGDSGLPTGIGVEVTVIDDDVHLRHTAFDSVQNIAEIRRNNSSAQTKSGDSHGTEVVGALLAVAGGIDLQFIQEKESPLHDEKIGINDVTTSRTAFSTLNNTAHIVNCSWGEFPLQARKKEEGETDDEYKMGFFLAKRTMIAYWKGCCEARPSQLFVWTAGNATVYKLQGRPAQAYLSHLENVIVVGGAFPVGCTINLRKKLKLSGDGVTEAVPDALGGMRYLPDGRLIDPDAHFHADPDAPSVSAAIKPNQHTSASICGLLGPGVGGIMLPNTKMQPSGQNNGNVGGPALEALADLWIVDKGTSFAAPQVAAVAAMVREVWPGASPADVKHILTETSTPIRQGQTFENLSLWDDARGVHVGMVHIGRAVQLATFCAQVVNGIVRTSSKRIIGLLRSNSAHFSGRLLWKKVVLNSLSSPDLLELDFRQAIAFIKEHKSEL